MVEAQAMGQSLTTTKFFNYIPDDVYKKHLACLCDAGMRVLARENRPFIVDESNEQVIRFLIHYFNRCRSAESVYPDKGYKLHKNIALCGDVGAGKTVLMQAFSMYLRRINSPMQFLNLSVGQMVNYYTIHNNLDKYTYNEDESKAFQYSPINICLNDIGLDLTSFYGTGTKDLCSEFLFARSEIWQFYDKYCHLTTNLSAQLLKDYFNDDFGRINDRFKYYNLIHLSGESRR
jgi:hypothetical protein